MLFVVWCNPLNAFKINDSVPTCDKKIYFDSTISYSLPRRILLLVKRFYSKAFRIVINIAVGEGSRSDERRKHIDNGLHMKGMCLQTEQNFCVFAWTRKCFTFFLFHLSSALLGVELQINKVNGTLNFFYYWPARIAFTHVVSSLFNFPLK